MKNGPADRMGLTIVNGRCFSAKNANTQEHVIKILLIEMYTWSFQVKEGIYRSISLKESTNHIEPINTGVKANKLAKLVTKSSGKTAFPFTLYFLQRLFKLRNSAVSNP